MHVVGWVLVAVGPFEDYANNVTAAAADTVLLLRDPQELRHFAFTPASRESTLAAKPPLSLAGQRPEQSPPIELHLARLW